PAMDNQSFAKAPAPATTGTVYSGPTPTQGTVYGGSTSTTAPKTAPQTGVSPAVVSSANWFFYIAGLSLLYTFVLGGTNRFSLVGLGITHYIGNIGSVAVAGVMALFGVFARQGQKWAFLIGMLAYAVDGVLLATNGVFLSVVFHGLILFYI